MSDVVLQLKNVSKSFDGVTVLRDVDFTLRKGEIHSLVGQNGSGKSTLIKILSGVYRPDAGEAVINGEAASFPIRDARKRGLALIHQDLALVDGMSVAENVGVGVNFGADRGRPINRSRERATCKALLDEFEVSVSPDTLVAQLSPSERSVVAILRAIRELRENQESRDGIIILDEPTAALPSADAIRLTGFLRRITAQGTTALFVSHRLAEVLEISDRISVLRSGVLTGTHDSGELDQEGIITEMLGYRLGEFFPPRPKSSTRASVPNLHVEGLTGRAIEDVSFEVGEGEILGITGLAGMGHDEIPYLIAGSVPHVRGRVKAGGRVLDGSAQAAIGAGVALVPGNRKDDAVWLDGTALENVTLPIVSRFRRTGFLRHAHERKYAQTTLEAFSVQPPAIDQHLSRFSGGNQQKIVLARCLQDRPGILLLHEPTQGVDAAGRKEIFGMIRDVADSGTSVLLVSSEAEEVAMMSDRVLIVAHGKLELELAAHGLTEDRVISACQTAASAHKTEGGSK